MKYLRVNLFSTTGASTITAATATICVVEVLRKAISFHLDARIVYNYTEGSLSQLSNDTVFELSLNSEPRKSSRKYIVRPGT